MTKRRFRHILWNAYFLVAIACVALAPQVNWVAEALPLWQGLVVMACSGVAVVPLCWLLHRGIDRFVNWHEGLEDD